MSSEYNGWKLLDNIIVVIAAAENTKYGCRQGYIVDPKNKKQLESALDWGRRAVYEHDEDGNLLKDDKGILLWHYEDAKAVETDNKDFTLQLLESAGGSSQGGKLSFWNCLITKDDIKCVVGINSELLLELMLQSTFTNGVCDKKICFARKNGNVGALHPKMTQYKDAIKDNKIRKSVNTKKTSKWQLGHNYVTLSKNEFYLGNFYQPIKYDYNNETSWTMRKDVLHKLRTQTEYGKSKSGYVGCESIHVMEFDISKDRKEVLAEPENHIKSLMEKRPLSDVSLDDYISAFKNDFDTTLAENAKRTPDRRYNLTEFYTARWSGEGYLSTELLAKCPSRTPGNIQMEASDDYYAKVDELLRYMKEQVLNELRTGKYYTSERELIKLIKSTDGKLTELDLDLIYEILKCSAATNTNGYYVYKLMYDNNEEYLYTYEEIFNRIKELLQ